MIEKLGITPGKDGWDKDKCEMLEALIEMCLDAELLDQGSRFEGVEAIEKNTGLTWAEVKERIE
jgi:hypothetical protein